MASLTTDANSLAPNLLTLEIHMNATLSRAQLNALPALARLASPDKGYALFACNAYALGQFCIPYPVPVTRRRTTPKAH